MPSRATDPAVSIRDLTVRYRTRTAVDSLSFDVPAAGVTALLGPNGAGKTSTLEVCEGLRAPTSGTVSVLGADPRIRDPQARARVGVTLQAGGVPSGAHAVEFVRHVARLYRDPLDPDALCERLGLPQLGKTAYRRLSGGEKQRIALAVAVIGRPDLVFLDEPTAGLDPQSRMATWDLITELATGGTTVVLTTHYLEEAERLAERVVVIDEGRLVAEGRINDLVQQDRTSVTFSTENDAPIDLDDLRSALGPSVQIEQVKPGSYVAQGPRHSRLLADLTAWCANHEVALRDLSSGSRTLEDVFLELTGRDLSA